MRNFIIAIVLLISACKGDPLTEERNYVKLDSIAPELKAGEVTLIGCNSDGDQVVDEFNELAFFAVRATTTTCALKILDKNGNNILSGARNNGCILPVINLASNTLYCGDISVLEGEEVFNVSFDQDGNLTNYLSGERRFTSVHYHAENLLVVSNYIEMTDLNSGYTYSSYLDADGNATFRDVLHSNKKPLPMVTQLTMRGEFAGGVTQAVLVSDAGEFFSYSQLFIQSQVFERHHAVGPSSVVPHAGALFTIDELGEVRLAPNSETAHTLVDYINNIDIEIFPKESRSELWLECDFDGNDRHQMTLVTSNYFRYRYTQNVRTSATYGCRCFDSATSSQNICDQDAGLFEYMMFANGHQISEYLSDVKKIVVDAYGNIIVPVISGVNYLIDTYSVMDELLLPNVTISGPHNWRVFDLAQQSTERYGVGGITLEAGVYQSNSYYDGGQNAMLVRDDVDPFHEKFADQFVNGELLDGYITYEYKVNHIWSIDALSNAPTDITDADLITVTISDESIRPRLLR